MGRQGFADPSRMGICRTRRHRRRRVRLGDAFIPGGKPMANTWQGAFPHENLNSDGYARTSPVKAFPPNG
jgi:hypothetical protein